MHERWYWVAINGLWILGLSLCLAGFGYHHWLAREGGQAKGNSFTQRIWQPPQRLGMLLICVGWGLAQTSRVWETVLWLVLAAWIAAGLLSRSARSRIRGG